jgi:uncharacterized peroxidase-related enzyme
MTFFQPVPPWSDYPTKAFLPGAGRSPSGDTRREEDAECPRQTGVLVRKPTAFLHAKETSMPRANLVDTTATGAAKPLLDEIKGAFGTAPNMFRAVANSPAALKSKWGAFGALGAGTIGAKLGEKIAVAVADRDACSYCLAAHTLLGKKAGASGQDMADAQAGHSDDPRTAAALSFALKLVEHRGQVAGADIEALRAVGFDDGQIVEIIAHVALNLFTNYVNIALDVPVDFPSVRFRRAA